MYGYLPQASRQMSTMRSAHILSNAVSDMQRFYGLAVTGAMDHGTVTYVTLPSLLCSCHLCHPNAILLNQASLSHAYGSNHVNGFIP
jgi:hypothetical protein